MFNILTFETYNTHIIPDPNDRNIIPVVDYIDNDYFITDVEMDETEPPNPTGRNDRERKNMTKKSAIKMSAESVMTFEQFCL